MALVWRNGKAVHAMMASSFDLPNPVVWWNGMNRFVVESDENTLEKNRNHQPTKTLSSISAFYTLSLKMKTHGFLGLNDFFKTPGASWNKKRSTDV